VTDTNPEGLTAVNDGKWSRALAARLTSSGLSCRALDENAFRGAMYEKLIWICALMAVGAAHPGATVGDVVSDHRVEVVALVEELMAGSAAECGVAFEAGTVERLLAYSRTVAHFPTAVKELEWRNGQGGR
jgi:ketopantoate reductase